MLVANCETRQLREASAGRGAVSDWLELIQFDVCQLVVVDVLSEPGALDRVARALHRSEDGIDRDVADGLSLILVRGSRNIASAVADGDVN